jgi:hypothetical protein
VHQLNLADSDTDVWIVHDSFFDMPSWDYPLSILGTHVLQLKREVVLRLFADVQNATRLEKSLGTLGRISQALQISSKLCIMSNFGFQATTVLVACGGGR